MKPHSLYELVAALRTGDGMWSPGCSPAELDALAARARAELGADLPADYLALLTLTDGAACQGAIVFPSRTRLCDTDPADTCWEKGVIEMNLDFRQALPTHFGDVILLGDTELDWLVWHLPTKTAQARGRGSRTVFAQFDRAAGLFWYALGRPLGLTGPVGGSQQ